MEAVSGECEQGHREGRGYVTLRARAIHFRLGRGAGEAGEFRAAQDRLRQSRLGLQLRLDDRREL